MPKRNSPERKQELTARRERQRTAVATKPVRASGYIPAGANKNTKASNR